MAQSQYGLHEGSRRWSSCPPCWRAKQCISFKRFICWQPPNPGQGLLCGLQSALRPASSSRSLRPMLHAARVCTTDPPQRSYCAIGPYGATPSRPRKWTCVCKQPFAAHCIFSAAHKMRAHSGLVARIPTNARLLDRYKLLACVWWFPYQDAAGSLRPEARRMLASFE